MKKRECINSFLCALLVILLCICSAAEATDDFDFTLSKESLELTRYIGGSTSYSTWSYVHINEYNTLKDEIAEDPQWTYTMEHEEYFRIDFRSRVEEAELWMPLAENMTPPIGDYNGTISCRWNGITKTIPFIIHVKENPDGIPTGMGGISDEWITMSLGETIVLKPYALPVGWTVPGFEEDNGGNLFVCKEASGMSHVDWQERNSIFTITDEYDPNTNFYNYSITALKPGIYKVRVMRGLVNFRFDEYQGIIVLNEDGTEPESLYGEFNFTDETVTAKAGTPYTLKINGKMPNPDNVIFPYSDKWVELTEYAFDLENKEIVCTTSEPGYYKLTLSRWNNFLQEQNSASVLIIITDEAGNLPKLNDIVLSPVWPLSAVVGDSHHVDMYWYNSIEPSVWRIEIEHNGEKTVYDTETGTGDIVFTEKGTYTLNCTVTDSLERTATATATTVVNDPGPLTVTGAEIVRIQENGPDDHDVWYTLDYSGGYHIPSVHAQIFPQNAKGEWYMTWEQDYSLSNPIHFWIGEDGYHYFKSQITDGVTKKEISTSVFLVGSIPHIPELVLPSNLISIEEDAFANNTELQTVVASAGLKRIGARAFAGCTELSRITLPSGIEYIDETAFSGITKMTIICDSETGIVADFAQRHGYTLEKPAQVN